jgi:hypothetical protein
LDLFKLCAPIAAEVRSRLRGHPVITDEDLTSVFHAHQEGAAGVAGLRWGATLPDVTNLVVLDDWDALPTGCSNGIHHSAVARIANGRARSAIPTATTAIMDRVVWDIIWTATILATRTREDHHRVNVYVAVTSVHLDLVPGFVEFTIEHKMATKNY